MNRRQVYRILKTALDDWLQDNATLRAAALTFFIILPLPTLLLIIVAILSLFLGQTQAIQVLVQQMTLVVGPSIAALFQQLLLHADSPFSSVWTAVVVVGFSAGGAIGAFSVLRDSMDYIWEITLSKHRPLWKRVKQRIVPFVIVSALGLIVIFWTAIGNRLFTVIQRFSYGLLADIAIGVTQVLLSFSLATLLLAIIYKKIPDANVYWQDVTLSALITGVAFTVTNYVFGIYISIFTITTVAGVAGSLLIILLWIFVLNEIVLYGAEASRVYATTIGTHAPMHFTQKLSNPRPNNKGRKSGSGTTPKERK